MIYITSFNRIILKVIFPYIVTKTCNTYEQVHMKRPINIKIAHTKLLKE